MDETMNLNRIFLREKLTVKQFTALKYCMCPKLINPEHDERLIL
jgi:hypothetical protein